MKKTVARILVVMLVLQALVFIAPISAEKNDVFKRNKENFVPDEIIVKFKNGVTNNAVSSIYLSEGLSVISKSSYSGFHRFKIPEGKTTSEMIEKLNKDPYVEYAEPNYIAQISMTPNDPGFSYQWHLLGLDDGGIDMESAWDLATGSGAVVAVIDTGISVGTDLAGTCFVDGYDFVNNDNDPTDDNGHGTHVAGTVAQSTNNNLGVCGVAFDACLMPVKVLNQYGSGTYADVIDGINFAVNNGANIISMSFGGSFPSQGLEDALASAYNSGVTCVAASGNGYGNGIDYPAAYDDYVIAVGATQYDKTRAPYSDYGNSLDVVAPGGNTGVDQNGDGYADGVLQQTFYPSWGYYFFQGTSMATPHVSGTAALLYSNGVTTPDDIRSALENSAVDLGSTGWDIYYGHGLINAYNALQYTQGDNPPTCSITSPEDGATVSGDVTIEVTAMDDNGVTKVDFYVDSTFLGSDNTAPYSWLWDSTTVDDGTYTITATAYDTASQSTSDSIDVTVDNIYEPFNEEFYDSFEVGEWNGLWVEDSQNDWFRSTQRSSDGSYSAEVDGSATDATLTMVDSIDLSDKSGAELTFSWYIESGFDSGEYIALDVYDGGWQEVKRLRGNVDQENVWHHETIDLGSYLVNSFKIRFRARVSRSTEDGNVDKVKIVSYGGQPNTPPDVPSNPVPADGAIDVGTSPTLSVDVSDIDGDVMDITFYDASDDSAIGTDTNVPSDSTASVVWSGLEYETTYSWYAVADDGSDTTQSIPWYFTTEIAPPNNSPDEPTNPVPVDEAIDISLSPTLEVDVNDIDGDTMTIYFYEQGSGLIGSDIVTGSGTATTTWTDATEYTTTYYWYTVADDGIDQTTSPIWSFTTEDEPSETTEFYDSFEVGEWNGLWVEDSQNDWFRSTQRSSDGSYSAEVDGSASDVTLTLSSAIDLSGKSLATLTFSWFIERGFDSGEYIALDVYEGGWQEVKRLRGNVDQENIWHHETIDLSLYMNSEFKIRFRARVSRSNEDGFVDNVKIVSYT